VPKYEISFAGNKVFSSQVLLAKTAEYATAYDQLEKAYYDLGYFHYYADEDREASANSKPPDVEVANFKITIKEGPQYKVASIKLEGKASIPVDQLNGAILLHEGELFTQKSLNDSIDRLNQLGLTLDKDKDVGVSTNDALELVNIVIVLSKDRRSKESFNRASMKRSWYP
jgi:outer membrane protein assembly factor BamA